MKFHIVQVNEKIQDISRKYNVSIDEISKLNRHVHNINHVVPGMKIRLPILTEPINDEIQDDFIDIEKYYPKLEDFKDANIEPKSNYDDAKEIETNQYQQGEKAEVNSQPYPYQQPYYQQPQPQSQYYQQPNPPYQQPYYYPQQPQPQYQPQPPQYYQQPQQMPYYPPQQNFQYENRDEHQKQEAVSETEENNKKVDLTEPQYIENTDGEIDPKLFEQPAFCEPNRDEEEQEQASNVYQPYKTFFQNPLFNPPYPINRQVEEDDPYNFDIKIEEENRDELGFDEEVKVIKADLREFVKRHTQVKKKKDKLDLL